MFRIQNLDAVVNSEYPMNVIGFLTMGGVLTKYDCLAVRNDYQLIADNFMKWCHKHYSPVTERMYRAVFIDHDTKDFPEWKEKINYLSMSIGKGKTSFMETLLGKTASVRSKFMEDAEAIYVGRFNLPVGDTKMDLEFSKEVLEAARRYDIPDYKTLAKMIINEEFTVKDIHNDAIAINILERELVHIKFINYLSGGDFDVSNIIVPFLMRPSDEMSSRKTEVLERKTSNLEAFKSISIQPYTHYGIRLITKQTVGALARANIKTIGDLLEAVKNNYDFCSLNGISVYTAYKLFTYAAIMNGHVSYIG